MVLYEEDIQEWTHTHTDEDYDTLCEKRHCVSFLVHFWLGVCHFINSKLRQELQA